MGHRVLQCTLFKLWILHIKEITGVRGEITGVRGEIIIGVRGEIIGMYILFYRSRLSYTNAKKNYRERKRCVILMVSLPRLRRHHYPV